MTETKTDKPLSLRERYLAAQSSKAKERIASLPDQLRSAARLGHSTYGVAQYRVWAEAAALSERSSHWLKLLTNYLQEHGLQPRYIILPAHAGESLPAHMMPLAPDVLSKTAEEHILYVSWHGPVSATDSLLVRELKGLRDAAIPTLVTQAIKGCDSLIEAEFARGFATVYQFAGLMKPEPLFPFNGAKANLTGVAHLIWDHVSRSDELKPRLLKIPSDTIDIPGLGPIFVGDRGCVHSIVASWFDETTSTEARNKVKQPGADGAQSATVRKPRTEYCVVMWGNPATAGCRRLAPQNFDERSLAWQAKHDSGGELRSVTDAEHSAVHNAPVPSALYGGGLVIEERFLGQVLTVLNAFQFASMPTRLGPLPGRVDLRNVRRTVYICPKAVFTPLNLWACYELVMADTADGRAVHPLTAEEERLLSASVGILRERTASGTHRCFIHKSDLAEACKALGARVAHKHEAPMNSDDQSFANLWTGTPAKSGEGSQDLLSSVQSPARDDKPAAVAVVISDTEKQPGSDRAPRPSFPHTVVPDGTTEDVDAALAELDPKK